MQLRCYQDDIFNQVAPAVSNDVVQLDTGAGKTPILAAQSAQAQYSLAIAHRNVLIAQISDKLAAYGLHHDTISSEHTRRRCMATHRRHGRNYIQRGHQTRLVASIDSLISHYKRGRLQLDTSLPWLILVDEAHHVVPDNKWGLLRRIFPHARFVGYTATPARMDGQSLHVSKGGLFDRLVQAEALRKNGTRWLIEHGYLCDFKVFAASKAAKPKNGANDWLLAMRCASDRTLEENKLLEHYDSGAQMSDAQLLKLHMRAAERDAELFASGLVEEQLALKSKHYDYISHPQQREHVFANRGRRMTLYGDPVAEYQQHGNGGRAIMMCPSIQNGEEFAREFRDHGIAAACIHSLMSPVAIARLLDAFAAGRLRLLTNVDMIGEGFDLPAAEVLIIAARTGSFPRYRQWVGRVLRPDGDKIGVIIDHTGMVADHGMPDDHVEWDLISPPIGIPRLSHAPCDECGRYYPIKDPRCPECGAENALHMQRIIGNYYVKLDRLDMSLVQQARVAISAQKREQRRHDEIIWPAFPTPSGLIGRTIVELRQWFVARLQAGGIGNYQINAFLDSPAAADQAFWMRHFTAADLKQKSAAKAKKVFEQWQASR